MRDPDHSSAHPGRGRLAAVLLVAALTLLAGCSGVLDGVSGPTGGGTGVGGTGVDGGTGGTDDGTGTAPGSGGGTVSGGSGTVPGAGAPDQPAGTLVFPKAGVRDPRPVAVQGMSLQPSDGHVVIRLDWVSGVEPCSVLAGVTTHRAGDTFTLTVMEGSLVQQVACPDIAMYKATLVDLGALGPGTYTVTAEPGFAPPLTVTLP
jgi:hypothetical protein